MLTAFKDTFSISVWFKESLNQVDREVQWFIQTLLESHELLKVRFWFGYDYKNSDFGGSMTTKVLI